MKRYIDEMQSRGREIENEVDSKNLFDSGITRAIKSARQSLGLDQDQEHKAIRKGLFRFSDALTQQYGDPRYTNRKGAVNNLASIAPAMAKGLEGYEDASDNIQHNNREVYEWAKKFRDSEIKRLRDEDKEAFDRYFADKKLGIELAKLDEQRNHHQQQLAAKSMPKETPFDKKHKLGLTGLKKTIAEAKKTINYNKALAESTGKSSKGEAGFTRRKLNDFGLVQLTPEQAEIETLGSLLAGYGNKMMNFTNQVEFESLPHISPYNSDATNQAILKKIEDIMIRDAEEHGGLGSGTYDNTSTPAIMPDRFTPRAVNVDNAFDEDDFGDL